MNDEKFEKDVDDVLDEAARNALTGPDSADPDLRGEKSDPPASGLPVQDTPADTTQTRVLLVLAYSDEVAEANVVQFHDDLSADLSGTVQREHGAGEINAVRVPFNDRRAAMYWVNLP